MTSTPSDPSPSQEPSVAPDAGAKISDEANWAKAATTVHEVRFPDKGEVRLNPLDHGLERKKEADRGIEM